MNDRSIFSLAASIVAAGTLFAACDPGDDPVEPTPDAAVDPDPDPLPECDTWYLDSDGDGHGDRFDAGMVSCAPIPGRARTNRDCDDTSKYVHPDRTELCDGIDNNCDGSIEPAAVCPPGCRAETRPGSPKRYMSCISLSNFSFARNRCDAHGMDLVHVNDSTENVWVASVIRGRNPVLGAVWLGGSDAAAEGQWNWLDNAQRFWTGGAGGVGEPGVFTQWISGEPNNSGGEHCLDLQLWGGNANGWNDIVCSTSLASMCERK